jgi:TonB family protein
MRARFMTCWLVPALIVLAAPSAVAEVKWVNPPQFMDKVSVAFDAVRYDADTHGDSDADTAIAYASADDLRGEWFFRGGDFMHAPTSYARFQEMPDSGDVLVTFVCEDTAETCAKLRQRAQEQARRLDAAPPPPPPPPAPPGYVPPPQLPVAPTERRREPIDFKHHFETDPVCDQCAGPVYPEAMVSSGTGGRVMLLVSYDAKGTVTDVSVTSSSGSRELDAAAMEAARAWVVRPGTVDGRRVAGTARVPVEFDPPLLPQAE